MELSNSQFNKASLFDIKDCILEPNSQCTFRYDDFEITIKTNKFIALSFSNKVPQFTFHPIEKFTDSWTKTN